LGVEAGVVDCVHLSVRGGGGLVLWVAGVAGSGK
jgi:hypothetical protein